jgi:probable S-adenosylmethionine-dependent methyltransferase, YraL family
MKTQKSFKNGVATLFLVATPIGNLDEMTFRAIKTLNEVDCIVAEDTRNTIKLLNYFNIKNKMISHHQHNIQKSIPKIIQMLQENQNIALVSDAGYPAISDPGYELVKAVLDVGLNVVCISGANAGLNALVVSGIKPQPFIFYGFLDHSDKKKRKQLDNLKYYQETLIFYESPYRLIKTLELMLHAFGNREIVICRELTKLHEEMLRGKISEILDYLDEIKGEIVLIVEGSKTIKEEEVLYEISILEHVNKYIADGLSTRDAIKQVAKARKLGKNEVYSEFVQENNK